MKGLRINERGFVEKIGHIDAVGGTHLVGTFIAPYKELKRIFGAPNAEGDSYKTDAEWTLSTPNGVATIYNYKDGRNYLGKEGTATTKLTEWHIGGTDVNTFAWVALAIFNN